MKTNNWFRVIAVGILSMTILGAVSGCTTRYGVASFKSVPDGVQVYDMEDGAVIGVTPIDYVWRSSEVKRKFMNVRLHKTGYQDVVKSFWLLLEHSSEKKAMANPQLVQFEMIAE